MVDLVAGRSPPLSEPLLHPRRRPVVVRKRLQVLTRNGRAARRASDDAISFFVDPPRTGRLSTARKLPRCARLELIPRLVLRGTDTPGDATLDGLVDFLDFSVMSGNWNVLLGQLFVDGDFNGDGAVNFLDFSTLSGTWQEDLRFLFVLADLDGDFDVDGVDTGTIAGNQGMPNSTYEDGDLDGDGDGDIDPADLALAQIQEDFGVEFDWVENA